MVDANIPDIALEPDKTVKKVCMVLTFCLQNFSGKISCSFFARPLQVQDKFRLDLSDEEAVHYMQSLIDESVGALFAAVVEQIHKFAQVCMLKNQHGKQQSLLSLTFQDVTKDKLCCCLHFYGWQQWGFFWPVLLNCGIHHQLLSRFCLDASCYN